MLFIRLLSKIGPVRVGRANTTCRDVMDTLVPEDSCTLSPFPTAAKVKFRVRGVLIGLMQNVSIVWMGSSLASANHCSGLHVQLPTKLIDIAERDIEQLDVFQLRPDSASVMLRLKPALAAQLHKLTEKIIGQSIVWIWNGRVLAVQTLQAPIDADLTVYNFTPYEAQDFKRQNTQKAYRRV